MADKTDSSKSSGMSKWGMGRWAAIALIPCVFFLLLNRCSPEKSTGTTVASTKEATIVTQRKATTTMVGVGVFSSSTPGVPVQQVALNPINMKCPPISYLKQSCEVDESGSGLVGFVNEVRDCAHIHLQPMISSGAYKSVNMLRGNGMTDSVTVEPTAEQSASAPPSMGMEVLPKHKIKIIYWAQDEACVATSATSAPSPSQDPSDSSSEKI